jgi:hypothetical protein
MLRSVTRLFACFVAALAATGVIADDSLLRRYELPNRDTLELSLPAGWTDHFEQPAGGGPPTIEIAVAGGGAAQVFVTPKWAEPTDKELRELPLLRDAVRELAERIQPEAVESFIEIRPLDGANGAGYYFTATERDPKSDGFKFMSQGALQASGLTLWFVILTNEGQDTVAVQALGMLQSAVHRRTGLDQL